VVSACERDFFSFDASSTSNRKMVYWPNSTPVDQKEYREDAMSGSNYAAAGACTTIPAKLSIAWEKSSRFSGPAARVAVGEALALWVDDTDLMEAEADLLADLLALVVWVEDVV